MPIMENQQGGGQGGGGAPPDPQGWQYNPGEQSDNWFNNFSGWYNQMPDQNSESWDLGNLMEWQRQGQNMDPTFLQWANHFQNGGGAPGGGMNFPGGGQGSDTPPSQGNDPPPWMQEGNGWLDLFGGATGFDPSVPGLTSRWDDVTAIGNSLGMFDSMMNNPSQSTSQWHQQFGNPYTAGNQSMFQQGGSAYLDPAMAEAQMMDPTMMNASSMTAALSGGPSASRAMQMAQGAQDVAQRGAMLQSGAAAQQMGNRRMNPAAMAAVMGDINRQASASTSNAGANAYSQGMQADMQTQSMNQNARHQANTNNAQWQQQAGMANQQASNQASAANQQWQNQFGLANQQATNAGQQFNIGNQLQNMYTNQGVQNQDRNDRMLSWQNFQNSRDSQAQFMMDWILRSAYGQEGWVG
jgi:hypothetical protein